MKREPKRHGLCRWHWSELTVICDARWAAAATMNTASYIRAASVWHRQNAHFYTTPNTDMILMHLEKLVKGPSGHKYTTQTLCILRKGLLSRHQNRCAGIKT